MATESLTPPDEREDQQPLFGDDPELRQGVYDDEFQRILDRRQPDEAPESDDTQEPARKFDSQTLAGAEAKTASPTAIERGAAGAEDQVGEGYSQETGRLRNLRAKGRGWIKRHRKLLFGVGFGLSGLIVAVAIFFFYIGSLMIPNLAAHISSYQFARLARNYASTNERLTGEKIMVDTVDDNIFTSMKNKYQATTGKIWESINSWKPEKVVDNLETSGKLGYVYEDSFSIKGFTRQKLKAIVVDGEEIPVSNRSRLSSFLSPIDSVKNRIELRSNMHTALDDSVYGRNALVRSRVSKEIRTRIDSKLFRWKRTGNKNDPADPDNYEGASEEKANVKNAQLTEKVATDDGKAYAQGASEELSASLKAGEQEAAEAAAKCDEACVAETIAKGETTPAAAQAAIERSVSADLLQKTVGTLSSVYAIALPVCLIYDGSIVNSNASIDANSSELERIYYTISSAADQQKKGHDVTAGAVGALNRQVRDGISSSNPEKQSNGEPIDTSQTLSPQAGAAGTVSILTAYFPNFLSRGLDTLAHNVCPKLTNIWVGLGLGIGELAVKIGLNFLPGVGQAADVGIVGGEAAAQQAVTTIIKEELISFARETFTKQAARDFVKVGAAIGAATFLARFIVVNRIATTHNGFAQGKDLVNEAHMGGNLVAQEENRSMLYAAPMTTPDILESNNEDFAYLSRQGQSKSVVERYFALTNPDSLATRFGMASYGRLHVSSVTTVLGAGAQLLNPAASLGSIFGSTYHTRALAAETKDTQHYNIVQWGWTAKEEARIDNDPSMQHPLENEYVLTQSGHRQDIADKYGKCFDLHNTMGKVISQQWIVRDKHGNLNPDAGDCAPNKLGPDNNEFGPAMVFRWRIAMRNQNVTNHMLDMQNITAGDSTVGGAQAGGIAIDRANLYAASDTIDCAVGTTTIPDIQTGYHNGQPVPIRLCGLPDLPSVASESQPPGPANPFGINGAAGKGLVNARLSGALLALVTAAKAAGLPLGASSTFRSMAKQQALFAANPDPTEVAIPGYSNHQMGLAIDFTCSGTIVGKGDPCFAWLSQNAGAYGISNYPVEAWHWSADGK